eukprot:c23575_g1_i1 orf=1-324(-)
MASFYSSQWPRWSLCVRGSETLTLVSGEKLCNFWKCSRKRPQTACASSSNGAPFLRENEMEQQKNQKQVPLMGEERDKGFISEEWLPAGSVDDAYVADNEAVDDDDDA